MCEGTKQEQREWFTVGKLKKAFVACVFYEPDGKRNTEPLILKVIKIFSEANNYSSHNHFHKVTCTVKHLFSIKLPAEQLAPQAIVVSTGA